jgi:hypothetical protein
MTVSKGDREEHDDRRWASGFVTGLVFGWLPAFLLGLFLTRAAMDSVTATAILPHVAGFDVEEHGDVWVVSKGGRFGVSPTLAGAFADWGEGEGKGEGEGRP